MNRTLLPFIILSLLLHGSFFALADEGQKPDCLAEEENMNDPQNETAKKQDTPHPEIPNEPQNIGVGDLVINELVSDPLEGSEEWVELFNTTDHEISLNGWYLEEGAGSRTILQGVLASKKFFVVRPITGNLNNSGDILLLKSQEGATIDRVSYGDWDDGNISDNAPVAKKPDSLARDATSSFSATPQPTPGSENVFPPAPTNPTPTQPIDESAIVEPETTETPPTEHEETQDSPDEEDSLTDADTDEPNSTDGQATTYAHEYPMIIISELLPDPEGSDSLEWIELHNPQEFDVILDNWQLDDLEGGSKPHTIHDITITAKKFLLFSREITQLALNNDADHVRLITPDGLMVSSVEYTDSKPGESYASTGTGYAWTMTPTPGAENIITLPPTESHPATDEPFSTTLEDVRSFDPGDRVIVEGTVSVEPGILGSQIMYITGSPGIQIYSYKKAWPDTIALGDRIRVMGTLSENSGEDKINITTPEDIESLSHGAPPTPIEMNAKIDKQLEGQLVIFTGTFIEKRGSKLFLENSFEEVVVSVKSSTKITVPDLRPGSEVTVAGIVSQNNGVFQVLPRYQEDITATEPLLDTAKTPTNTETIHQTPKKESWPILTFLVLGMLVAGGVLVYQKWRTATLLREDEQRESHIES